MTDLKELIFDIETTGLSLRVHGIYQMAGIIRVNKKIVDKFNFYVNLFPSDEYADDLYGPSAFNKLPHKSKEEIATYEDPIDVFFKLKDILYTHVDRYSTKDKYIFCAYNSDFDFDRFRVWNDKCYSYDIDNRIDKNLKRFYFGSLFFTPSLDLKAISINAIKQYRYYLPNFKQSTVCKFFNIPVKEDSLHGAEYDVELSEQLMNKLDFVNGVDHNKFLSIINHDYLDETKGLNNKKGTKEFDGSNRVADARNKVIRREAEIFKR